MEESTIIWLEEMRADERNTFAEPAAENDLIKKREEGYTLPADLMELYRFANGFSLYSTAGESPFKLLSLSELHHPIKLLENPDDWDYSLHGDPKRLTAFFTGNGSFISCTRLGVKKDRWVDDYREGIAGVLATSVSALLSQIKKGLYQEGERFLLRMPAATPMPKGYTRAVERLHKKQQEEMMKRFAAEPYDDDANDLSDV